MSRRRLGGLICALSALLAATGCGSDHHGPAAITTADAYSAAIRWYLDSADATPSTSTAGNGSDALIVYLAPASGKAIDSQVQASVVSDIADMKNRVTVRFADVRDDALDVETPDMPVKDHGVMLIVGTVTEGPPPVDVEVEVYRSVNDDSPITMRITASDDAFRATAVSGA